MVSSSCFLKTFPTGLCGVLNDKHFGARRDRTASSHHYSSEKILQAKTYRSSSKSMDQSLLVGLSTLGGGGCNGT